MRASRSNACAARARACARPSTLSRPWRALILALLFAAIAQAALAPSPAAAARRHPGRGREPVASIAPPDENEAAGTAGEGTNTGTGEAATPGEGAGRGGEARLARADGCRLALGADPASVTAGETATLTGTFTCSAGAAGLVAGQSITLFQHSVGSTGFQSAGTALTEAGGTFSITTEALAADSSFYVAGAGARSGRVRVLVSPLVTVSGPPVGAQLFLVRRRFAASSGPSSTVTFTGAVTPDGAGGRVVLEREFGQEDWLRVGAAEVGASGGYTITHTFGLAGEVRVRILARDHGRMGISETLTYQISRPQNERLTIQASAPSLTYGQGLTISGVLNGGGRAALTLLASSGGGDFAPVTSTFSEADGSYVFAPQTPLQDTLYRVRTGRLFSTMLFAGVKPALVVRVSQASVEDGRPVTFTGTVAPARAGERINLERANAGGSGFHIVAQSTLAANGSFSIEHVLSEEGTQELRIVVPGSHSMQAVSTSAIAVQGTSDRADLPTAQAPAGGLAAG